MNIYRFLMLLLRFPELLVDPKGHFELEYPQGICYPNNSSSRISWMHITAHVGTFERAKSSATAGRFGNNAISRRRIVSHIWEACYFRARSGLI